MLPVIWERLNEALKRMSPQAGDYKLADVKTQHRYTAATTWLLNFTEVERECAGVGVRVAG